MTSIAASSPALAAQSLSLVRGGRQLFQNLSLSVQPGELWQIEGGNGAGKTSLMRIFAGLSQYGYEGEVVCNVPLLYLGHHAAVKGLLSPRENLRLHPSGAADYSTAQIESALDKVGLYGYEDTPSHQLSAGQHRRVNLARLYLSDAPLWLLDEPFAAIDVEGVSALEKRIEEQVVKGGAVIVVSHQILNVACEVRRLALVAGNGT